MITIACTCLTLLHPGIAFQGHWAEANFKFRPGKMVDLEEKVVESGEIQDKTQDKVVMSSPHEAIGQEGGV